MGKFDDFDLDVTKTAAQGGIEPKYKSKLFIIIFRTNTNPHSISLWSDMASYTE